MILNKKNNILTIRELKFKIEWVIFKKPFSLNKRIQKI
jgi:hypothetical protein